MGYSEKISLLLEKGVLVSPEELKSEIVESLRTERSSVPKVKPLSTQKEEVKDSDSKVKIVFNYDKKSKKRSITDFVKFFNNRFKALENIIRQRPEMKGLTSINKIKLKGEKETLSIICMVSSKTITKNNNIILTVEDLTGQIAVLIHQNNKEFFEIAKDLVLDEVIGIVGVNGKNIIFTNSIVFPDVPLNMELKKSPKEEYAIFISDIHFGANNFLKKEFEKFISWVNGEMGNEEQRKIGAKIKYIFIVGDLVEGVGVYPGQEKDLDILDIKQQYAELAKLLRKIKGGKKLIICPGNHDAGRIAEPQPSLYNEFAGSICDLPNVILVSNPSIINIGSSETFSGLDVLLYHGYSLIYYANMVNSIRSAGGQKRVDLIMKFLMQKRHLAPTHESNLYIPDDESDPLVINKIPDVFVTGHIHRATVSQYRGITLLNTSCWSEVTEDQTKRGLEPQPGRVFALNTQTRKVNVINFLGQ